MTITKEQVQHIAQLARLSLTQEEVERFTPQLNDILRFAEKLNELDTEGVEATSHVLPMANVLREDEVRPACSREQVLVNAPEQKNGMFRVPPVFEE